MSEYRDYNWQSNVFTNAHSYLLDPTVNLISKKNDPILDVGCGNGAIANHLMGLGFNVYGTDASESGINIANKNYPGKFFLQDLTSDNLPKELQNINIKTIISTEVIEHLYDPRKYISFCKNVLLKGGGGDLIISTPFHGYIKNLILALTGKMDKHFTVLWDGGHIKFWSKRTLTILLEEQGFKIVKFVGCGRIPFLWKSMIIKASIK